MRTVQSEPDQIIADRVAAEVRAEMARQRISQQALANRMGWSQPRLSRRLMGSASTLAVPFTVPELTSIAAELGVPVSQFIRTPAGSAA